MTEESGVESSESGGEKTSCLEGEASSSDGLVTVGALSDGLRSSSLFSPSWWVTCGVGEGGAAERPVAASWVLLFLLLVSVELTATLFLPNLKMG